MVRKWERRHSERHAEVLVRTFRSELLESERFSLVLLLCLIFEACRARSLALPASLSQGRRCGHFDFEHVHDLDRSRFQLVSLYQPRHDRRREPFPTQFKPTDPAPVWVNYFITNLDQSDVSRPITKLYSNTSGKNVFVTGKVKLAGATYLQVSGTVSIDEKNGVPSIIQYAMDNSLVTADDPNGLYLVVPAYAPGKIIMLNKDSGSNDGPGGSCGWHSFAPSANQDLTTGWQYGWVPQKIGDYLAACGDYPAQITNNGEAESLMSVLNALHAHSTRILASVVFRHKQPFRRPVHRRAHRHHFPRDY